MDCIYSSATTSASHIFSNVTKAIESYIERKLPVGLLKGRSISTTIAPRFFKKVLLVVIYSTVLRLSAKLPHA